jgi:hypothetical protein
MRPKTICLLLCLLGAALPSSQFIPWVSENGLNPALLVREFFANRISAFFGVDVLVSSLVLLVFMRLESTRHGVPKRRLPIPGAAYRGRFTGVANVPLPAGAKVNHVVVQRNSKAE